MVVVRVAYLARVQYRVLSSKPVIGRARITLDL
jgi:hypothetical protein